MKDQDSADFEQWRNSPNVKRAYPVPEDTIDVFAEIGDEIWEAATERERDRNQKLVEALIKVEVYAVKNRNRELELIAYNALKEHRGEL